MKKLFSLFVFAILLYFPIQGKEFEKYRIRDGINNFYSKVNTNDSVRIIYFGGSITNAPGWRVKSFRHLKEQYPQCELIHINASIGGTGSNLGAFRFENDVLKHKPDLIFMEFAVNDSRTDSESIVRQYEGILRQLWTALPTCDICFVYTFKDEFAGDYRTGNLPYTIVAAEEIADYYGIASVNFGVEIISRNKKGTLPFRGEKSKIDGFEYFSKDGVHPFIETGHQIYFEDFKSFENQLAEERNNKPKVHKLRKPLFKDNWQAAKYLNLDDVTFSGDWKIPENGKSLYETDSPNASLSFEFEGSMLGIYDWIGPSGTTIDIHIDGKIQNKLRFDKHCNYDRANYFFIPDLEPGKHKVVIRMGKNLSPEEKVELVKERLPHAAELKHTFTKNKFRLKKIMIL